MELSKKQRQEVWDKSRKVCWYCGEALKVIIERWAE